MGKPNNNRRSGVVALCPSFSKAYDWHDYGAFLAKSDSIDSQVNKLKEGSFSNTLIIVNRYDGIDLPDSTCRVLIFDSKPFSEGLVERYEESCREGSEIIETKIARIIEQGLGRAVRGEKDYCAIILIGSDLIRFIRSQKTRKHFSSETQLQIELGLEIADMAKEDIGDGDKPIKVLRHLVLQALSRDEGWKEFYIERMKAIRSIDKPNNMLKIFATEMKAEKKYNDGNHNKAVKIIQKMLDEYQNEFSEYERGWYLQKMGRYILPVSKAESHKYQLAAHKNNHYLLKPST